MIPYISLAFMGGFLIGFGICRDLIKQELKTKTLCIGKRVYRVVHETKVKNEQFNFLGMVVGHLFLSGRSRIRLLRRSVSRKTVAD